MNAKEIYFGTKQENNQRRLKEVLARTPHERFLFFLKLSEEIIRLSPERSHPNDKKNNFIVK